MVDPHQNANIVNLSNNTNPYTDCMNEDDDNAVNGGQ